MSFETILYRVDNGVAIVSLNRPAQMNAFNKKMFEELPRALDLANADDTVRSVIITGSGRAFCAGADLSMNKNPFDRGDNARAPRAPRDEGGRLTLAMYRFPKPLICAINGPCVGIGATLTLATDIRIAAQDAKVGFVFVRRGIVPEGCSSYFLPRLVGQGKAAEWVMTGRVFTAQEEANSGLFNHVVPAAEVMPKAMAIARDIADNCAPISVALSKAMLQYDGESPEFAHLVESKGIAFTGSQPDALEGVMSFKEKRKPHFSMKLSRDMPNYYPWWDRMDVNHSRL